MPTTYDQSGAVVTEAPPVSPQVPALAPELPAALPAAPVPEPSLPAKPVAPPRFNEYGELVNAEPVDIEEVNRASDLLTRLLSEKSILSADKSVFVSDLFRKWQSMVSPPNEKPRHGYDLRDAHWLKLTDADMPIAHWALNRLEPAGFDVREALAVVEFGKILEQAALKEHARLAQQERKAAPAASTNTPAAARASLPADMYAIDAELTKIDTVRRTNHRAYVKDEAMQARERELLRLKYPD